MIMWSVALWLLFVIDGAYGQGLSFKVVPSFGSSETVYGALKNSWKVQHAASLKLQRTWSSRVRSECRQRPGQRQVVLCASAQAAVAAADQATALLVAAAPAAYSSRDALARPSDPIMVWDQGTCNACVAMAVAGAAQMACRASLQRLSSAATTATSNTPSTNPTTITTPTSSSRGYMQGGCALSPRALMFCGAARRDCSAGWYLEDALAALEAAPTSSARSSSGAQSGGSSSSSGGAAGGGGVVGLSSSLTPPGATSSATTTTSSGGAAAGGGGGGGVFPTEACLPWPTAGELKALVGGGLCGPSCPWTTLPGRFTTTFSSFAPLNQVWQMQQHIRTHGSVITRMVVTPGFRSFFADPANALRVYANTSEPTTIAGSALAGFEDHAVLLVGYNNTGGWWLIQNSWSGAWADRGYARVAFNTLGLADPSFTYGVKFTPAQGDSGDATGGTPVTQQRLPLVPDPALPPGCWWYVTRQGEYLAAVAQAAEVQVAQLLVWNADLVNDLGDVYPAGQRLRVCNVVPTRRLQGKLTGNIALLSVNRARSNMQYRQGDTGHPCCEQQRFIVTSEAECAAQCSLVYACSGWSYCGRPGGCGGDCRTSREPTEGVASPWGSPGVWGGVKGCMGSGDALPVLHDDWNDVGATRGAPLEIEAVCRGAAWPQHTCTLFWGGSWSDPALASPEVGTGWVSGVTSLPAQCQGAYQPPRTTSSSSNSSSEAALDATPFRAPLPNQQAAAVSSAECRACLGSPDPVGCLNCTRGLYAATGCGVDRRLWYAAAPSSVTLARWWGGRSCLPCTCLTSAAGRAECYQAAQRVNAHFSPAAFEAGRVVAAAAAACPDTGL